MVKMMMEWRETKQFLQLQPPSVIFVSFFFCICRICMNHNRMFILCYSRKNRKRKWPKKALHYNNNNKKFRQHATISFSTLIFYKVASNAQSEVYLNAKMCTIQIDFDQVVIFACIILYERRNVSLSLPTTSAHLSIA